MNIQQRNNSEQIFPPFISPSATNFFYQTRKTKKGEHISNQRKFDSNVFLMYFMDTIRWEKKCAQYRTYLFGVTHSFAKIVVLKLAVNLYTLQSENANL